MKARIRKTDRGNRADKKIDHKNTDSHSSIVRSTSGLGKMAAGCTCGGGCRRCLQRKATPGDTTASCDELLELEADRVAGRLVEAGLDGYSNATFPGWQHGRSISRASPGVTMLFPKLAGSGVPLPSKEQQFYSNMLGYDFSGVNIYTGRHAESAANSVKARAFTYGNDVVFNQGEYNPVHESGKRLLAHELTHVVQQNNSVSNAIQRTPQVVDCEAGARTNILHAERRAVQWIDFARRRLSNPLIISPELSYHFQISPEQTDVLSSIASIFDNVRDHIQREEFTYTCTPESDSRCEDVGDNRFAGFAYFGSRSIYFCGGVTHSGESNLVRLLIHEAIHAMIGGLDDGPYISDPTYPGPDPLSNTDAYASFIHDIATSRVYGMRQRPQHVSAGALPESGYSSSGSRNGQETDLAGFAVDSAILSQAARDYLDIFLQDWYDTIGATPVVIRLAGHTDRSESPSRMATVSRQRAVAVADYLMENMERYGLFLPADVQIVSYLSSRPFTADRSATGQALNRRVSIEVIRAP